MTTSRCRLRRWRSASKQRAPPSLAQVARSRDEIPITSHPAPDPIWHLRLYGYVEAPSETHEFSVTGYVISRAEMREVYLGGSRLGWFVQKDTALRNILLIAASRAIGVDMRKLAKAFGIAEAMGRNIRRRYREQGIRAIVDSRRGGRERKLTPKLQAPLERLFEKGLMIDAAHEKIRRCVSRTLVGRAHKQWIDARKADEDGEPQCEKTTVMSVQAQELKPQAAEALSDDVAKVVVARERRAPTPSVVVAGPIAESERPQPRHGDSPSNAPQQLLPVVSEIEQPVQHLGSWVMLAMLNALGIYAYAGGIATEDPSSRGQD